MPQNLLDVNTQNYQEILMNNNNPIVLYFHSENTPICKSFEPVFIKMSEEFSNNIQFAKVTVENDLEIFKKFKVSSAPTVIFLRTGIEHCSRLNGYIVKSELQRAIEDFINQRCALRERTSVYCDVLIIGGGPAGLSASLYTSRANLFTIIVDEGFCGGQVVSTYDIQNYPGTKGAITGLDLTENMKQQTKNFNTRIDEFTEIIGVNFSDQTKHIQSQDTDYFAKAVVIATGAQPRKLPVNEESKFRGRGIHYCATCDGALYQDAEVIVVGGGNSAVEEAVFLTKYAKKVIIVHESDTFQASKHAQEEMKNNSKINIILNSHITEVYGDSFVKGVIVKSLLTGEIQKLSADGVFVYIGMQPKTDILKNTIELDKHGNIITDEYMKTSIEGVFAAGDVRKKNIRQIATAVGDGVTAGILVEKYLAGKS